MNLHAANLMLATQQACVSLYIVWANRSFRPPLALTRCRTCADRREDAGSCPDIDYEPTMAFTPQPGGVPHWGCSHSHVRMTAMIMQSGTCVSAHRMVGP